MSSIYRIIEFYKKDVYIYLKIETYFLGLFYRPSFKKTMFKTSATKRRSYEIFAVKALDNFLIKFRNFESLSFYNVYK